MNNDHTCGSLKNFEYNIACIYVTDAISRREEYLATSFLKRLYVLTMYIWFNINREWLHESNTVDFTRERCA